MKTKIDMHNLLQLAEELVSDGYIELAESCEIPVQILESDNGDKYQLSLTMSLINEDKKDEPKMSADEIHNFVEEDPYVAAHTIIALLAELEAERAKAQCYFNMLP